MKKLMIVLGFTTVAMSGMAKKTYVRGGLNLANITKTNDGQTEKTICSLHLM